jgi:hypothetical protein
VPDDVTRPSYEVLAALVMSLREELVQTQAVLARTGDELEQVAIRNNAGAVLRQPLVRVEQAECHRKRSPQVERPEIDKLMPAQWCWNGCEAPYDRLRSSTRGAAGALDRQTRARRRAMTVEFETSALWTAHRNTPRP